METETIINIIYYSQTIDNRGRTESSSRGHNIFSMLNDPLNWSDDLFFEDNKGNIYSIDDLEGKTIHIPEIGVITVPFG